MGLKRVKFAIIGAGSVCFCPATLSDILLSAEFGKVPLLISLMDIDEKALRVSEFYAQEAIKLSRREVSLTATTNLELALEGADFVVTAIEVNRYYYWSMDFHIPRRYGFRQIYGENGGPGGMFHFLRNLPPMLNIAKTMESVCPNAWLLNYTNPEAKLVEAISKLTSTKVVGLCHGEEMGRNQLAMILELSNEELITEVSGINHFGWFTRITQRSTGKDLYPLLRDKEREMNWLSHWDELGLARLMLRTYGLFSYPGTNHIGEYIAWSDAMLASSSIQFFYDPAREDLWDGSKTPEFVYSFSSNPTARPLFSKKEFQDSSESHYREQFKTNALQLVSSREYGIPIAEAIAFNLRREIGAVNTLNRGAVSSLPLDMVVEVPAIVDGTGIHPKNPDRLPLPIVSMIQTQGAINQLLIEAYLEKSRVKILQAVLLDPTISSYNNAVSLINEMCLRQEEILPKLNW